MHHENETKNKLLELMLELTAQSCYEMSDLADITQCWSLIRFRKVVPLTWSVFVLPLLILAAGIYVVCQPQEGASLPFTILGIACIFYGISEFLNGWRLHRYQKRLARAEAEAAAEEARKAELEAQMSRAEEAEYEEVGDGETA
ncbi:MAG: hypothetical protein IKO12_01245 [Bacteroidaceae bacterium]|nr:hypothetical protein [Bacteroidaceae bacterium]